MKRRPKYQTCIYYLTSLKKLSIHSMSNISKCFSLSSLYFMIWLQFLRLFSLSLTLRSRYSLLQTMKINKLTYKKKRNEIVVGLFLSSYVNFIRNDNYKAKKLKVKRPTLLICPQKK